MRGKWLLFCAFFILLLYGRNLYRLLVRTVPQHHLTRISDSSSFLKEVNFIVPPKQFELRQGYVRLNHFVCTNDSGKEEIPLRNCFGLRQRPRDESTRLPVPRDTSVPSPFFNKTVNADLMAYWESGNIVHFQPPMTDLQYEKSLELLRDLITLLNLLRSIWWPSSGTIIGVMRHSDRVPWDDDLDINILITDFIPFLGVLDAPTWDPTLLVDPVTGSPQVVDDKTKVSLEEMIKSEYTDFSQKTIGRAWWIKHQHEFTSDEMRLINHYQNKLRVYAGRITGSCGKIFFRDPHEPMVRPWLFPFIDLFCWTTDFEKTVFQSLSDAEQNISFSDFFPLHSHPFGPFSVPIPYKVIKSMQPYAEEIFTECVSGQWDHVNECGQHSAYGKCPDFYNVLPFVRLRKVIYVSLHDIPKWILERLQPLVQISMDMFRLHFQQCSEIVHEMFKTTLDQVYYKPTEAPPETTTRPITSTEVTLTNGKADEGTSEDTKSARRVLTAVDQKNFLRSAHRRLSENSTIGIESTKFYGDHREALHSPKRIAEELLIQKAFSSNRKDTIDESSSSFLQSTKTFNQNQLKDIQHLYERLIFLQRKQRTDHDRSKRLVFNPAVIDVTIEEVWMGTEIISTSFLFGGDYTGLERERLP